MIPDQPDDHDHDHRDTDHRTEKYDGDVEDDRSPQRAATDEQLVIALTDGLSQVEAAQRCGVSERTVRRRLRDPAFLRDLHAYRLVVHEVVQGRAFAQMREAVDVVGDLMATSANDRVRLAAALALLKMGDQARVDDLNDRITALEQADQPSTSTDWDPPPMIRPDSDDTDG